MQAALVELPPRPQLEALDISECKLVAVPASVAAQTALTSLQLGYNRWVNGVACLGSRSLVCAQC